MRRQLSERELKQQLEFINTIQQLNRYSIKKMDNNMYIISAINIAAGGGEFHVFTGDIREVTAFLLGMQEFS